MKKFFIEKYEKYHPKPQWLIDISPNSSKNSDFYVLWLTRGRKFWMVVIGLLIILSIFYNLTSLLFL